MGPQPRNAGTPFNPEPWVDPGNCVKCVASLLDYIFNDDFVMQANEYPTTQVNAGMIPRALSYLHEQVGVTFDAQVRPVAGAALPAGDYVVFSNFVEGRPSHISFGRAWGGPLDFYDPQSGSTSAPSGSYVVYRVIYPE